MRPTRGVARLTSGAVASVGSFAAWPGGPQSGHNQAGLLDRDAGSSKSVMPGRQPYRNQGADQEDNTPGWAEAKVGRHTKQHARKNVGRCPGEGGQNIDGI